MAAPNQTTGSVPGLGGGPDRTLNPPRRTLRYLWATSDPEVYETPMEPTSLGVTFDGGGEPIEAEKSADLFVPFDSVIRAWTLLTDTTGVITIDILRCTFDTFPTDLTPLTGSVLPKVDSLTFPDSQSAYDANLAGWDPNLYAGDVLRFVVLENEDVEQATLQLRVERIWRSELRSDLPFLAQLDARSPA